MMGGAAVAGVSARTVRHAATMMGLHAQATALGLAPSEIAAAEQRGRTELDVTPEQALREAMRQRALGK